MDAQPQEIRQQKDPVQQLQNACYQSTQVIIARRVFPNEDYDWIYSQQDVTIVRANLSAQGRTSEIKTVMNSKESRIVLVVSPVRKAAAKAVHGTILKKKEK